MHRPSGLQHKFRLPDAVFFGSVSCTWGPHVRLVSFACMGGGWILHHWLNLACCWLKCPLHALPEIHHTVHMSHAAGVFACHSALHLSYYSRICLHDALLLRACQTTSCRGWRAAERNLRLTHAVYMAGWITRSRRAPGTSTLLHEMIHSATQPAACTACWC